MLSWRNLLCLDAVAGLQSDGTSLSQEMSPKLKSPPIMMFGWFGTLVNTWLIESEK